MIGPPPLTSPLKGEGDCEASAPPSPLRGGVRGGGSGEAAQRLHPYAIALPLRGMPAPRQKLRRAEVAGRHWSNRSVQSGDKFAYVENCLLRQPIVSIHSDQLFFIFSHQFYSRSPPPPYHGPHRSCGNRVRTGDQGERRRPPPPGSVPGGERARNRPAVPEAQGDSLRRRHCGEAARLPVRSGKDHPLIGCSREEREAE